VISVIIPVYNAGKYLSACLQSVVEQTYCDLDIILINDGSTDDSLEICRKFEKNDSRIRVFDQNNSGVSAARNKGISVAKGQWFSFVDSDDYLEPEAYEHCLSLADEHSCDAVCYEFYASFPDREKLHETPKDCYGILDRKQTMKLLHSRLPFTWAYLFRRKLVEGLRFDTKICRGEDTKFNTEALHRAQNVYFSDKPLYHYVQTEQSACRGRFRTSQLTAVKLLDFYPDFFAKNYPELLDGFYSRMCHLMITLFFDMHADEIDYRKEQTELHKRYCEVYSKMNKKSISSKIKLKFGLFRYFPKIFCHFHKVLWKIER